MLNMQPNTMSLDALSALASAGDTSPVSLLVTTRATALRAAWHTLDGWRTSFEMLREKAEEHAFGRAMVGKMSPPLVLAQVCR